MAHGILLCLGAFAFVALAQSPVTGGVLGRIFSPLAHDPSLLESITLRAIFPTELRQASLCF